MATIKAQLGYPDASVLVGESGTLVAVVDKKAGDRVTWKSLPAGGGYVPDRWRPLLDALSSSQVGEQVALLNYAAFRRQGADRTIAGLRWGKEHADAVRSIWRRLSALDQRRDFDLAVQALDHNGSADARRLAALVLANSLDNDAAWWALAHALRDPADRVRSTAGQLLFSAAREAPRRVDWRPAARSIAHLLDGTNLGGLTLLVQTLVATGIDPALTPVLVEPGAHALLDFVAARTGFAHDPARRLLEHLTGARCGRDAHGWREALRVK